VTTISDDCETRSRLCSTSSTTIIITKVNSTNYAQWAIKMALYLEQKQLCGIIKEYDDKPEESARNATATENAAFDD
jgi:hypothetical protein